MQKRASVSNKTSSDSLTLTTALLGLIKYGLLPALIYLAGEKLNTIESIQSKILVEQTALSAQISELRISQATTQITTKKDIELLSFRLEKLEIFYNDLIGKLYSRRPTGSNNGRDSQAVGKPIDI